MAGNSLDSNASDPVPDARDAADICRRSAGLESKRSGAGSLRVARGKDRFARDLEGLICTAREHGLSDEEILAKVLAAADALGEGLT